MFINWLGIHKIDDTHKKRKIVQRKVAEYV
jgi:hypothetical protein